MLLEALICGGAAWYVSRNVVQVSLRQSPLTGAVNKVRTVANDFVAGFRDERAAYVEDQRARETAKTICSTEFADIMKSASQEERDTLIAILAKNCHQDK